MTAAFDVFGSEDPMAWEGIGKSRITKSANRGVVTAMKDATIHFGDCCYSDPYPNKVGTNKNIRERKVSPTNSQGDQVPKSVYIVYSISINFGGGFSRTK